MHSHTLIYGLLPFVFLVLNFYLWLMKLLETPGSKRAIVLELLWCWSCIPLMVLVFLWYSNVLGTN